MALRHRMVRSDLPRWLGKVSPAAKWLYVLLEMEAEERGIVLVDVEDLALSAWPRDLDGEEAVAACLEELDKRKRIIRYTDAEGRELIWCAGFTKHQDIPLRDRLRCVVRMAKGRALPDPPHLKDKPKPWAADLGEAWSYLRDPDRTKYKREYPSTSPDAWSLPEAFRYLEAHPGPPAKVVESRSQSRSKRVGTGTGTRPSTGTRTDPGTGARTPEGTYGTSRDGAATPKAAPPLDPLFDAEQRAKAAARGES